MLFSIVWLLFTLALALLCVKKRTYSRYDVPISPCRSEESTVSKGLLWSARGFFFLFCALWAALFLETVFPSFQSPSWLLSSNEPQQEKQFPYAAALFIVDRSGSMQTPLFGSKSRLDFAKECVRDVVQTVDKERQGKDVFGLMECARLAPLLVPLTRNRDFFDHILNQITPEKEIKLNGTALGYALFKGSFLLMALEQYAKRNNIETLPRDAKSLVIITDGVEEIHPEDYGHPFRSLPFKEAMLQARSFNIRVWYILIASGDRPSLPSFAKEKLLRLTESTHGGFIELLPSHNKEAALEQVSQSLISSIQLPKGMKQKPQNLLELKLGIMILSLVCMRFSEFGRYRL